MKHTGFVYRECMVVLHIFNFYVLWTGLNRNLDLPVKSVFWNTIQDTASFREEWALSTYLQLTGHQQKNL